MKVIIIGGGVMGLACAWRLKQRGVDAVDLFDSRPFGGGATSASLGALWPANPLSTGPLQELHRASLWQFESFHRELQTASGLTVPFRRLGRIELLNTPRAIAKAPQDAAAACSSWPAFSKFPAMQVLSASEVTSEEPGIVSLAPDATALLCRVTAQVHVAQLLAALIRACELASVRLHPQTPAPAITDSAADIILVTAGTWTPLLDPLLARYAPITPAKGQGIALRRPTGFDLHRIVKSDKTYLIPWDDEILVGSTTEPEAGFDEVSTIAAREHLNASAVAIAPALEGAPILRHWAGLRPCGPSKGHPPIMGPVPGNPRLFVCAGHYKTGIGMAPLVSQLMARLIVDGKTPPQLEPFLPREKSRTNAPGDQTRR